MKKNILLVLTCLLSSFFLQACACKKNTTKKVDIAEVFNASWAITHISNHEFATDTESAPSMNFNWENKQVGGKTGCNSYFAGFETSGKNNIKFGNAGSTKMYCVESMDTEKAFLEALHSIDSYSIENSGNISFMDISGKVLLQATKKITEK